MPRPRGNRPAASPGKRIRRFATLILGLAPIITVTAIAGAITSPSGQRPCAVEFSKGITSHPIHLTLGADGDLYATENFPDRILQFNPNTNEAREFAVPANIQLHDAAPGPDGNVWFTTLTDKLGMLNPRTGALTFYPGITPGSQPHALLWDRDGYLYFTEQAASRMGRFDPKTHQITETSDGLPPGGWPHNLVQLPNGDLWTVLQQGDALAHFNIQTQRFDRFIPIPVKNSGPRDITYVPKANAIFATLFAANRLVEFNLTTNKLSVFSSPFKSISLHAADVSRTDTKLTFVRPDAQQTSLWMATLGGGDLLRFNIATRKMTQVYCGITFPAVTLGVANDRKGRLWFIEPLPGRIGRIER